MSPPTSISIFLFEELRNLWAAFKYLKQPHVEIDVMRNEAYSPSDKRSQRLKETHPAQYKRNFIVKHNCDLWVLPPSSCRHRWRTGEQGWLQRRCSHWVVSQVMPRPPFPIDWMMLCPPWTPDTPKPPGSRCSCYCSGCSDYGIAIGFDSFKQRKTETVELQHSDPNLTTDATLWKKSMTS